MLTASHGTKITQTKESCGRGPPICLNGNGEKVSTQTLFHVRTSLKPLSNYFAGRPAPFSTSYMVGREDKRTNNRTMLSTLKSNAAAGYQDPEKIRMQAVPFWIVERVRETGARRTKREETGGEAPLPKPPPLVCSSFFALGYFARPFDYPERECLQS